MIKKKVILIGILSVFAVFGCKKSQDSKKETITINFWDNEEKITAPYLDSIIASFEKNNPGVKVIRTYYSVDDIHRQFQNASIAGSPPDVILTTSDNTGLFVSNGLIMPLNGQFDFSQYMDNAVDAAIQDGKTWGVPNSYGNQLMLYYNTDYVKKPPRTTKDLLKLCDGIIKKKTKNNSSINMTCLEIDQSEPFWLIPFLTSYGGWPIDGHVPNLNTDTMIKTLEFIKTLKKKDYMSQECDYDCMDLKFKEGSTSMIINGDWILGAYIDSMKSKMKISVLPVNAETGIRMRPMISGKYFFISS
ncbi:MAG: extracellular solute-binding protein, partial [Proteobacteria bacterium]|nr:extracellular solute-binding protein [Pseudomonadota bacterium]